jgi:7-cyano-7-deazaguanine synthase in queuosine biosynthesis
MKLAYEIGSEKIVVQDDIPYVIPGGGELLKKTIHTYVASISSSKFRNMRGLPQSLIELLELYLYETYQDNVKLLKSEIQNERTSAPEVPLDNGKHLIAFSGGLDSFHLLIRLLEKGIKPEHIVCVHVYNLNRSEGPYALQACQKICAHFGVKLHVVKFSSSFKLNRAGHNIGLREQLILGIMAPYIYAYRTKHVWFGLYQDFEDIEAAIVTSNKRCFDLYQKFLASFGLLIEVHNHPDRPEIDEIGVVRDMVTRHRDLIDLSTSCYTQMNWREQCHDRLQKKFVSIPLYNGCGYCVKCMKMNGAYILWDAKRDTFLTHEVERLKQHILLFYASHKDEESLTRLVDFLNTSI